MPSLLAQVAAPSSSVLHGSPGLLPLKSQLVPFAVRRQPPGPLQGDSMKRPAWQMSSRLASRQRASPLSHELPAEGLQLASQSAAKAHTSSGVDRGRKAHSSLAQRRRARRQSARFLGSAQDRHHAGNYSTSLALYRSPSSSNELWGLARFRRDVARRLRPLVRR